MKKLLLTLASVSAVAAPLASTIACGTEVSSTPSEYDKTKLGIVTDAGSITDKSFNQQGWEAIKTVNPAATETTHVLEPANHDAATLATAYKTMVGKGINTLVTPGFYHDNSIKSFNKDNGVGVANFILIDSEIKSANVASVMYNTQQAAFMAGYFAASDLAADSTRPNVLGTFGGGNFPAVTDFMTGFVNGAKMWNEAQTVDENKVEFATLATDGAYTSTEFDAGGGKATADALIAAKAEIILPVAGPQTADTIQAFKDAGKTEGLSVIGVDTDQKLAYPADSDFLLTSILKAIELSVKNVASVLAGTPVEGIGGLGETTLGTLDNNMVGTATPPTGGDASITAVYTTATTGDVYTAAKATSGTWTEALTYLKANAKA